MNRNLIPVATLFLSTLPGIAYADLGETEQQLAARYGAPFRVLDDRRQTAPAEKYLGFKTRDFTVHVALLDGKSALEQVKFDTDITGPQDPRVKQVLDRQAKGAEWVLFPDPE